jgi:hypothetical protein
MEKIKYLAPARESNPDLQPVAIPTCTDEKYPNANTGIWARFTDEVRNQIRCLPTWRYSANTLTAYSGGPGSTVHTETDNIYSYTDFLSPSRHILGGKTTVSFPANHLLSHNK